MSPQQAHFDGTLTRGKLLLVDLAGAEVRHDPKHIVLVCTVVLLYAVHVRVSDNVSFTCLFLYVYVSMCLRKVRGPKYRALESLHANANASDGAQCGSDRFLP